MATRAAIATMEAEARGRLDRALARIADRLGVDVPAEPAYDRNPDYRAAQALGWHADVVEAIDAALAGSDEPPAAVGFDGMTRAELEAHAADLGLEDAGDKKRYPNKERLIEAIEAAGDDEAFVEEPAADEDEPMPPLADEGE